MQSTSPSERGHRYSSYEAVDGARNAADLVRWQERVDGWPAIQSYKRRTYHRLPSEGLVLDVGCGPGIDVLALDRERAIGVDLSQVMCRRAREHEVSVCCADAKALPFGDRVFAGCRADRVLQHLPEPVDVLREMVRVTAAGGRVVVSDPDQESLTIHVPGLRQEIIDRIKQCRRDQGYRNGRLASQLPELFTIVGLQDVTVEAFPLVLTDPDEAFGLPQWPHMQRQRGTVAWTDDELREWDRAMSRARTGGFVYALLYFVIAGTRE